MTAMKSILYAPEWLIAYAKEVSFDLLISKKVGEEVQKYRTRYGISQQHLGLLIGLRRESISRIENGSVAPTFEFVQRFTRVITIIEAVRVQRAEKREIDIPFLDRLSKELGFSQSELDLMLRLGVESYDKKLMKIQKTLR